MLIVAEDNLVQTPQGAQVSSSPALSTSGDGLSTASLDNLFQFRTTL